MPGAIALLSGLDSTLAILLMLKQGIRVNAIKFMTPFESYDPGRLAGEKNPFHVAEKFGFNIEVIHLAEKFLEIVINPPHGYGKNMNPCIDCRILMLKEAKRIMKRTEADFLITGEVLGQRPMSQKRDMLYHIDKEADVSGYVVRPLSAKLLRITQPEMKGTVNREMLYGISGRSRKPQMALAKELGLAEYPAPAGGCLLTEPNYANRLQNLLHYDHAPEMKDIELLKIGRHFRLSPSSKIIVGRDDGENEVIESLMTDLDCILRVEGHGSPATLVTGDVTDEIVKVAASICARYSDAKGLHKVEVKASRGRDIFNLTVSPAGNDLLETFRIRKIVQD